MSPRCVLGKFFYRVDIARALLMPLESRLPSKLRGDSLAFDHFLPFSYKEYLLDAFHVLRYSAH
jgi:hypothetical protein